MRAGDGGAGHEPGRKRSSSSTKNISLELLYKSGGLEQKMTLSPSVSHSRKASVEWLRSLKKVLSCTPEIRSFLVEAFVILGWAKVK